MNPKKIRPPQMWWVIEQQARRRRAHSTPSVPAMAEWFPHEVVVSWFVDGILKTGEWNAFAQFDPTTVQALDLSYTAVTSLVGLEKLTALEFLAVSYDNDLGEIPALPASLNTLEAAYSGLASLPDVTAAPNLTWINLHYCPNLQDADEMKITLMQQLDANGKSNGYLDIGNFSTGTPGGIAAITALTSKGWTVNV